MSSGHAKHAETYSVELQNAALNTISGTRFALASNAEYADLVPVTENVDFARDGFVGVYIKLGRQLGLRSN